MNLAGNARHAGRARDLLEEGLRLRRSLRAASLEGAAAQDRPGIRARLRALGYAE